MNITKPITIPSKADPRAGYVQGLRALADILEQHPEVPLPFTGTGTDLTFHFLHGDNPRAELVTAVRAFPGVKDKKVWDNYYDVSLTLHGLKVSMTAFRDVVCTRVVTGTETVTREVPDADALASVPTTTITETVETVEWICEPLTAPERVSA
jgi:hypothetical protein